MKRWSGVLIFIAILLLAGCVKPDQNYVPFQVSQNGQQQTLQAGTPRPPLFKLPIHKAGEVIPSPTPDAPRTLPTVRAKPESYTVQAGDTLGNIAAVYNVTLQDLVQANQIADPNLLSTGQTLVIPPTLLSAPGSAFKLIPDSEVPYGPATVILNVADFCKQQGGYINAYTQVIGAQTFSGPQVLERVAKEYSVNPRLLLTLLEFRSGWVTNPNPPGETLKDPLRMVDPARPDLYRQLSWAANAFNRGYYLWKINAISDYLLQDGSHVPPANTINAGTAAVQSTLGVLMGRSEWDAAISSSGWAAVFQRLFGYPFDYTLDPLVPANLTQPALQLPFKNDETWSFTGGPHGGWGEGSAWAALDFAPPGEGHGCVVPSNWVVAVANGKVVRSGDGVVVLDLDGDGYEQTGWTVLYLHIASEGRAPLGAELKAGDPIGHPSCEGGVANATHVHLARRYNGEWIAADGPVPFNLDGWISSGTGVEYNGKLIRNNVVVEAWDHYTPENQIHH